MQPILDVRNLTMDFGGLRAIDTVNLQVKPGEIMALIGPNGAGKTTLFNCITGIYTPTAGEVCINTKHIQSKVVNGFKPNEITAMGLARTFQNIRLFSKMTVLENVMVGQHCRSTTGIFGAIALNQRVKEEEQRIIHHSYELLKKVGLDQHANAVSSNLPYADQRRLEIARALATEPDLLLLDEPAAGMNSTETKDLDELITSICENEKVAILLIEHDMRLVMKISDHIVVVDHGKKIAEGRPEEIQNNEAVIRAYLGEDIDAEFN